MPHSAPPIGPVRILQVEDSQMDAELISMQLLDAGLEAEFLRVDSEPELERAMREFNPDLVLSDLSMPGFSGHEALRIAQGFSAALPFIFVSGTMGEETAVQALQQGAADYILKDKTARLPAAAARAIREARAAIERERVEKELLRSQRLDCMAMLAAGLSHDLRNILQPLLIVPDLLAIHSDNPKVRKLGDVVAECGRRGHEMAESMLSFVRGSRAARERVPVASLFQAVRLLLQGSLPRQVQLQVDAVEPDLVIEANYTELQQCLLNLCLNALQAMPDGGTPDARRRPGRDRWHRARPHAHQRHRHRHGCADAGAAVHAVLQHQERRHRPGPDVVQAHRGKLPGAHRGAQRSRPWHDVRADPAGGARTSTRQPRRPKAMASASWWWTVMRRACRWSATRSAARATIRCLRMTG